MKQYKCSRMTVSKVLTQLANARMIERRRKLGSFVSRPHSQSAVLTIPDIKAEVAALGQPYSFEVLRRARRRSTREDKALLGTGEVDLGAGARMSSHGRSRSRSVSSSA